MRENIRFDGRYAEAFLQNPQLDPLISSIQAAHHQIHQKTGKGNEYLGWLELPNTYDHVEFSRIKEAAACIQADSDVLIVIGIGGSYLGSRAVIESLTHTFHHQLSLSKRATPEIYFMGQNLSSTYMADLLEVLENKRISINVISKSGTTTEPALAFRILKEYMEKKLGTEETRKRIYVTTDEQKGALREMAAQEGNETFVIPDDIGGRYSVLTAVGLLPIAVSGLDLDELMAGAVAGYDLYQQERWEDNPCYQYAGYRHRLYQAGYLIELLVQYEPKLYTFTEWWKQLYGESEGKDKKGIFPANLAFTTDLHSMGQYIQEGPRHIFETILKVNQPQRELWIPFTMDNLDGFNDVAGKSIDYVNQRACEGSMLAHVDGGVPILQIDIPKISEFTMGQLIYFFEKACAVSGYLMDVNPFDQPGVEAYKRNMFALLGKKGYEIERNRLLERLKKG